MSFTASCPISAFIPKEKIPDPHSQPEALAQGQCELKQEGETSSMIFSIPLLHLGFSYGSAGKESACSVGDLGLIPGLGRFPGEGKGYPLQYSGLENSLTS